MCSQRNDGARASAALVHLHQGPRPLDPFRRYCKLGKKDCFRQFRWGYEKFVGFWPKKARENPRGRASFPPGIFPCFPRMQGIRVGVFDAGPEAITAPSRVCLQSTAGVCFLVRLTNILLCGSRGIIPLVRSGLKAQRNPFVRLPFVTFTLYTDAVKILEEELYKMF